VGIAPPQLDNQPASSGAPLEEAGFLLIFLALMSTAAQGIAIFLPVCDIYHLPLPPLSW
jgi:hypothetical protein